MAVRLGSSKKNLLWYICVVVHFSKIKCREIKVKQLFMYYIMHTGPLIERWSESGHLADEFLFS